MEVRKQAPTPSSESIPETVRIDAIVRDERYQFRPLDRGTVRRYASVYRSEVPMPPVKVAQINGAFILTDGWHRVAALESLGRGQVEALVEPVKSEREVHWLAAKANTEHGLPLKSKEYRKVFRAFVSARKHRRADGSYKSYRDIAVEIGGARAHTTIRNWMEKDFPSVFRAMGGPDEPWDERPDITTPAVSLAVVVLEALKEARAGMPGVIDPYDRGEVVAQLEEMLDEAKGLPWKPPEF